MAGPATRKAEQLASRHADEAVRALTRRPRSAIPALARLGEPAARAAASLVPRNARRLAMLAEDGTFARIGRTEELLAAVDSHGDRAMDFIWRHKGALVVSATLAVFLAEPEAFLGGGRELAGTAAHEVSWALADAADAAQDWLRCIGRRVAVAALALPSSLAVLWLWLRLTRRLRRGSDR